jgi:ATP-dependent helicase/nuclease subunit B
VIVLAGGFGEVAPAAIARLEYLHLSGRGEGGAVCERGVRDRDKNGKPAVSLPEALQQTEARMRELVAHYAEADAEYWSRKIPRRGGDYAGDYDHLARVAEWSVAEDADFGGEA